MSHEILLIADDETARQRYQRLLRAFGYDIQWHEDLTAGIAAARMGPYLAIVLCQNRPEWNPLEFLRQVKITDVMTRCVIISAQATVEAAVQAMREGAADYLREPCSAEELRAVLAQLEPTGGEGFHMEPATGMSHDLPVFQDMIGRCSAMRQLFALIERIAPSDATVLVSGESGTGKEMVVRAIHRLSHRRNQPFLGCDCTALAPTLLESELFGHVRGSFSGAVAAKKGLFDAAHQGTLLLDEVANLSMETQGKLLRVLETRHVRKVGDTQEHEVDIRLIATTNRSLGEMVNSGSFRADLYYRLNVVPVTLPPLRERTGDIPLLAGTFLEWFCGQMNLEVKGFSSEAMHQMLVYAWPGNVRELRNIVERLSVLYGGTQIQLHQLPSEIREAQVQVASTEMPRTWEEFKSLKRQIVDDLERRFLFAALERCAHNITQAAESVGMQRPNFHALLRHHDWKSDHARTH